MPSYAQLCPAMPCLGDRFLHSPVALRTRRYCILVYSVLGEAVSYALPGGLVPALTSSPAYPSILYPSLFGPGEGISYAQLCPAMPCLWDRFLHPPVTQRTRRCCILVCSVLGEVISYALPGDWFLHSPVTQRTRRYCILVYWLLGAVISYAQLCSAIPCLGDRLRHSPVALRTRRY